MFLSLIAPVGLLGEVMNEPVRILLLAGTSEAVALNRLLAGREGVKLFTSLAGRTTEPVQLRGEVVSGGFGGKEGFADFLEKRRISLVIDATHPFADQITRTAFDVCAAKKISFLHFQRPAWKKHLGDYWISVDSMQEAARKLDNFNRIFLTIGRQELSYFQKVSGKHFLIRSIEDVDFGPSESVADFIHARGPFSEELEYQLLVDHRIDLLVSKNSGGSATYAKIAAARELDIPVLMVERPAHLDCATFSDIDDLLAEAKL